MKLPATCYYCDREFKRKASDKGVLSHCTSTSCDVCRTCHTRRTAQVKAGPA